VESKANLLQFEHQNSIFAFSGDHSLSSDGRFGLGEKFHTLKAIA